MDITNWKWFNIKDLFSVQLSKGDLMVKDLDIGDVPLISSGESNNGIVGYVDKYGDGIAEIFSKDKITFDMFGNLYFQNYDFYSVSHGRVNILTPKFNI